MNKREVVLSLKDDVATLPYIPAGFFIHFDPKFHRGQAAVDKHMEYFRYTGMDFVKIQYENRFPLRPEIRKPEDWGKMPSYGSDFYEDQVNIAERLVESAGKEALVVMTLYSAFMCAGHSVGKDVLAAHLQENPEQTKKGIEIITDSLLTFIRHCKLAGIDGFYHSTQGGETHRFEGSSIFDDCIKPFDLALMEEIEKNFEFNILHVCDYEGGYRDLTPFLAYPGHVINASLILGTQTITAKEISTLFGRPYMGGLDRHGIITSGNHDEIRDAVNTACKQAPQNFILGADCTLPGEINWENIKVAIDTAHQYKDGA
jgi:uroporphyrinogen decarboxylase